MEDAKQKQLKTVGLVLLAVLGVGAAIFSGVKSLTPEKENIVGSLDGTGPGSTVAPRGGMRDAAAGEGQANTEERPVVGR